MQNQHPTLEAGEGGKTESRLLGWPLDPSGSGVGGQGLGPMALQLHLGDRENTLHPTYLDIKTKLRHLERGVPNSTGRSLGTGL